MLPKDEDLRPMSNFLSITTYSLLFSTVILTGCGERQSTSSPTQVAAQVNGDEITVHQVNNLMGRYPSITPETADAAKHDVLRRLIDQQLAKQQAIEQKLHRTPAVMQSLDIARNEILARAYLEQIAAGQPKPTPEEVSKYYADHPELFTQRRIFSLEEILVLPQEGIVVDLRKQVEKARTMQEVATWLNASNIRFNSKRGVLAAEDVPLEVLPKLQAMKEREIRLIESGPRLQVFHVISIQRAPLNEGEARPRIEQFLLNQRINEAVMMKMNQLKETASIVYMGEFADTESQPQTHTLSSEPTADGETDTSIERGLRSLGR